MHGIYRAQRKDNKEWVYGCLILDDCGTFIASRNPVKERVGNETLAIHAVEVIPETVCQFTGLYDSTTWDELPETERTRFLSEWNYKDNRQNLASDWEGRMIWENDIVRNHMGFEQVVVFENGSWWFIQLLDFVYGERQGENFPATEKQRAGFNMPCHLKDKKIGNIFDQKEMLEELL